ncbi:DinB family protein [Dokdonia sinensis]|uniref:DinB family protein n=1 Tax=Dokdonia sinensis TaxID=2479847 RepID=A0A3M0FXG7_9FLAO|nr:DinB family protein [Dokdonia sinensis]RMB57364.1 DinB family protein [Dokdonia sinensis]
MKRTDLKLEEFNPYYSLYIDKVDSNRELMEALEKGKAETIAFFTQIPEDKLEYSYAQGKWTPKEVLLHLIDTERIFSYRALRSSRKETVNLPGFEQDDYVINSNASSRNMHSLLREYSAVRESTITLYENLTNKQLKHLGMGSGSAFSARALGFINAGHEIHHIQILEERYL